MFRVLAHNLIGQKRAARRLMRGLAFFSLALDENGPRVNIMSSVADLESASALIDVGRRARLQRLNIRENILHVVRKATIVTPVARGRVPSHHHLTVALCITHQNKLHTSEVGIKQLQRNHTFIPPSPYPYAHPIKVS